MFIRLSKQYIYIYRIYNNQSNLSDVFFLFNIDILVFRIR